MRKCPKCDNQTLGEHWTQTQMIDRCANCGGQYYDQEELDSIIDMVKILQEIKLDEPDIETLDEVSRSRYDCPEDGGKMNRKDFGGVTVDTCQKCGGIWLDKGEIIGLKATEDHIQNNIKLYIHLASGIVNKEVDNV